MLIAQSGERSWNLCDTSEMEVLIRNLEYRDADEWNVLFRSYLDFYATSRSEEAMARIWRQVLGSSPQLQGVVAEAGGRVVGLAHFWFQPSTWAEVANCYLEDLFVEKSARGQGIAQALIGEVTSRAQDFGCTELFWITAQDNVVARKTYDKVATKSTYVRYEIDLKETR